MKISVWDDDPVIATRWKAELEGVVSDSELSLEAPSPEEIEQDLRILHGRRKRYLGSDGTDVGQHKSSLDDTDVLLVDNDLFGLPDLKDYSAEMVAARAGLYTTCGYIVVLNLSPDLDFDLTLSGHPSSKADLHINDKFVADSGLWRECPKDDGGFRPWHWPLLLRAASLHRARVAELVDVFEGDTSKRPILDYFGFDEFSVRRLSRAARAFLHPEMIAEEVSFLQFAVENVNAVDVKDGKCIVDREDKGKLAQVCARRIAKWLERYVLGPQDVLLDYPHLVAKMPFAIPKAEQGNVEFWNSCAQLNEVPINLIEEFGITGFAANNWFDRPVFWAHGIESDENLDRLFSAQNANPLELVFCEDSSSFHPSELCDQFVAAHNTVSDRRFIRWFGNEGLRYGPQSRLAM